MLTGAPIRLRHLTLTPTGGIGNRLRAIASARRLCRNVGARCSIIWDWGNFNDFFEPLGDVSVIHGNFSRSTRQIQHQPLSKNPSPARTVDVTLESVELVSGTVFWGTHEAPILDWAVLRPLIPRVGARLIQSADEFIARNSIDAMVGMHIRRTDHKNARQYSPDLLFLNAAREIDASGRGIFLATDNSNTDVAMRNAFPGSIVTFPKRNPLESRWPRPFSAEDTQDDLIELTILSRTVYVLGSYWSSYSYLAIVLNGSPECKILKVD